MSIELSALRPKSREIIIWKPDEDIRTHHLKLPVVQAALVRRRDSVIRREAKKSFKYFRNSRDSFDQNEDTYYTDLIGQSPQEEQEFLANSSQFYLRINRLKPDATLLVSPAQDGLCRSCVIGKHCDTLNAKVRQGKITAGFALDDALTWELLDAIKDNGFKEGIDYIPGATGELTYRDFGKSSLRDGAPVSEGEYVGLALLVKKRTLQELVAYKKLPPAFYDE